MGRIQVLNDVVINKIAAGEVVERPASVLKELLENALDAGAHKVVCELELGGTRRITVTDDGEGMEADDALLSVRRHATSKIRAADDLFQVTTMGFRGEALAAIAAVSRFTLATRRRGSEQGARLTLGQMGCPDGEEHIPDVQPWSGAEGTSVHVESLFYNLPARAKFLKSPATEFAHALELVQSYALCRPNVSFRLLHNGRDALSAPAVDAPESGPFGAAALAARSGQILGADVAKQLVYVESKGRYGALEALISPPGVERATARHMLLFVNGRMVRDRLLRFAVLRGYHTHLLKGRFPVAVLHLTVDPALVDVNVHPAKTEVRFQYPDEVSELIVSAIRERLRRADWSSATGAFMPQTSSVTAATAPFARTDRELERAPAPSALSPSREPGAVQASALIAGGEEGEEGQSASDHNDGDAVRPREGARGAGEAPSPSYFAAAKAAPRDADDAGERMGFRDHAAERRPDRSSSYRAHDHGDTQRSPSSVHGDRDAGGIRKTVRSFEALGHSVSPSFASTGPESTRITSAPFVAANSSGASTIAPTPVTNKASLDALLGLTPNLLGDFDGQEASATCEEGGVIPWHQLTFVGAFARCFLFFADGERLLVVDQHAFHERIIFERLRRDPGLCKQQQGLLVPEAVELAASEVALLLEARERLSAFGFALEASAPTTLEVHGVPALLARADVQVVMGALVHSLQDPVALMDPLLATIACHAAVRAGEDLGEPELKRLLHEAGEVDFYHNCPHGRRVFRWWTRGQVARWFDR